MMMEIYRAINENKNVLIKSCAGSGKTTSIVDIVNKYPTKSILILCFNRMLTDKTTKLIELNTNAECHTYHSFVLNYYDVKSSTDEGIIESFDKQPLKNIKYDILIIDECQDMTSIYSKLIEKIIIDYCSSTIIICLFGDEKQMIYEYKGASTQYMYKILKSKPENKIIETNKSYRITKQMSEFLNKGFNMNITSDKDEGNKIRCIETDNRWYATYQECEYYINKGYCESDIYIICSSVKCKKTSSIKYLQQLLTRKCILIEIPITDVNPLFYKNKLLINTIHGMKGLENKVVIFSMFDKQFEDIFSKSSESCPNEIYVALTRASTHLSLICQNGEYIKSFNKSILENKNIIDIYECYYYSNLNLIYPDLQIDDSSIECKCKKIILTGKLNYLNEFMIYNKCNKCIPDYITSYIINSKFKYTNKISDINSNLNLDKIENNFQSLLISNKTDNINDKTNEKINENKPEKVRSMSVKDLISYISIDKTIKINEYIKQNYKIEDEIKYKIKNIKTYEKQIVKNGLEIWESTTSLILQIIKYYIEYKKTSNIKISNEMFKILKVKNNKYASIKNITEKLYNEDSEGIEALTCLSIVAEMMYMNYTHRAFFQLTNTKYLIDYKNLNEIFSAYEKEFINPEFNKFYFIDYFSDKDSDKNSDKNSDDNIDKKILKINLTCFVDIVSNKTHGYNIIYNPYETTEQILNLILILYISKLDKMSFINLATGNLKTVCKFDNISDNKLNSIIDILVYK